jgi:hypothetical protein
MRRSLWGFAAIFLLFAGFVWRLSGIGEADPPLLIGLPIQTLRQTIGDTYKIVDSEILRESPFDGAFANVTYTKTRIMVADGVLIQETVCQGNDLTPSFILFTYVPDEATEFSLSLDEDILPYYDKGEFANGAAAYRRSSRSVMPTTEYTYVADGRSHTVYSVCDFVVCPGKNTMSWALSNPELTDAEIQLIIGNLQNEPFGKSPCWKSALPEDPCPSDWIPACLLFSEQHATPDDQSSGVSFLRENQKSAPLPASEATPISPSMRSTMSLAMASPSPVPDVRIRDLSTL